MIEHRLLAVGAILLLAVLLVVALRRLRVPALVIFLGLGMLLGSEGIGGIYFDNAGLARGIGVVALVAILFEGGLAADWRDLRPVLLPALLLSTVGVVVTAAVTGLAAYYLLDLSLLASFLLGAIVGSTDAAAVFAMLRFTRLRNRLAALLNAESGANDPMAVALTLGLVEWLTTPGYAGADLAVLLARQLALGLVIGIGLGYLGTELFRRLPLELAPFAPVASAAAAATSYGLAELAGGSGFLCVYVVGLWLGNAPLPLRRSIASFQEGAAYTAQIVLFIGLGLLVFPSRLGPVALPGLALAAVLLLVARPLAVLASTLRQRFSLRERVFLSWTGLRGAVPIVLATFALSAGVGSSETIFNAVFFVVLLSAILQGLTLEPLARRLRLADEPSHHHPPLEVGAVQALGAEILEYQAAAGDAVVGSCVRETGLPRSAIVMLIVRDGAGIPPRGRTTIEAGDRLYVLATADSRVEVERLLEAWQRGPLAPPLRSVEEAR
jgi:cell volume regulation protein A